MPSGFTAAIADGIEFKDFAMQCARAFGALVTMGDEPMDARIPEEFQSCSYHLQRVSEARRRQVELEAMSPAAAETAAQRAYDEALQSRNKYLRDKANLRKKYQAMLLQVRAWQPPTTDHASLKEFMEKQITASIDFDCVVHGETPELQSGAEWLAGQLRQVKDSLAYHSKHHAEEVRRAHGRSEWLRQLRESLR